MTTRAAGAPAILLVIAGLLCQDIGASLAVLLFPKTGPLGMVMLRLVFSALILLVIARPRLRGHSASGWRAVIAFGIVLALMNSLFYLALNHLPLGVTVTIEVLGPLALSIIAAQRASAWLWAGLAFAGVVALAGGGWDRLNVVGVLFALGAAASWALYILSSARVGGEFPKLDGLALAMSIGAIVSLPLGIADAGAALLQPLVIGLGAAVAMLSSTIPYAFELIALRRIPASVFAVLMSVSPAVATLAGLVLLGQRLTWVELVGIALVIAASMGAVWSGMSRRPPQIAPSAQAREAPEAEEPFAEPIA